MKKADINKTSYEDKKKHTKIKIIISVINKSA